MGLILKYTRLINLITILIWRLPGNRQRIKDSQCSNVKNNGKTVTKKLRQSKDSEAVKAKLKVYGQDSGLERKW